MNLEKKCNFYRNSCISPNIIRIIKLKIRPAFSCDLPRIEMSLEWVTGPEQSKSSGTVATFSLWTCVLWDGISSIPDEKVIPL
jgi:hypothetical protein